MPESFFLLSKENLELARDEVIAIAKTFDRYAKARMISNLLIIQSTALSDRITRRASFVKISGQLFRKMSSLFLDEENFVMLKNAKTFSCRAINLTARKIDSSELEDTMGNMISKASLAKVSLDNPEITLYLILTEEQSFFGLTENLPEQERPKKVKSHPHELDWKLTRAMINLAGLREGETVCDPFCGTGTTLLEAEAMGIHAIGIDFDENMCKISKQNLEANGYKSEVINADYKELQRFQNKFDGIVTDLPYGRASKSSQDPERLVRNFIEILPRKKKFAIMCKKGFEDKLDISLSKRYEIYRHKSLTRIILVK